MTRISAVCATDPEANDLGDNKPTSPRACTSIPFGDTRDDDDDEDFFDAEAGWTEDEEDNKKGNSAFSYSQQLSLGVGAISISGGNIAKQLCSCTSKKLSLDDTNLSGEAKEYVRVIHDITGRT
eukprot:scaffold82227_cov58-Attheya_sp.AAC.2